MTDMPVGKPMTNMPVGKPVPLPRAAPGVPCRPADVGRSAIVAARRSGDLDGGGWTYTCRNYMGHNYIGLYGP